MVNLVTALFGPLVESECRRALGRGWLILVRTLAALAILSVTMLVLWYAWICVNINPFYRPYSDIRTGLTIVEGLLVTIALVLAPAVLAGSLAGEKERGALGLLLTTRVTSREVVAGRFAGKMTQVVMILLVGMPAIILLAALTGSGGRVLGVLLLLPVAVAVGGGGLASAISALSRRGRDALLSVYLIDLVFLLGPLVGGLGMIPVSLDWLTVLNPYACLGSLLWQERFDEVLLSIGLWTGLGLLGIVVASWRLAPACLGHLDGARLGRAGKRRRRVPPLQDLPMVWKELYIESAGTLGGLGWWVGAGLSLFLVAGSLSMGGVILWDWWQGRDLSASSWAQTMLQVGVGGSSMVVAWLIEWAIGLRAAVTIASERERGTWDAILTSPLEAREIVRAKLWGSLFALRGLFAAALIAWTTAAAAGTIPLDDYADLVVGTLTISAFMAAVGIRASLTSATATRAMAVTIGVWLGALIGFTIFSGILIGIGWVILMLAGSLLSGSALMSPAAAGLTGIPGLMVVLSLMARFGPYLVSTIVLIGATSLRFDRLAGRSAGGPLAIAGDRVPTPSPSKSLATVTGPAPDTSTALALQLNSFEGSPPSSNEVAQEG